MALPKALQAGLTPDELTFLAEEEVLEIVPLFSMSRVRLLSGIYGPFEPPKRAGVPLWLALSLKRKRKCRIVPPDWLQVDKLQLLIKLERENEGLEALPRRFVETSKVLLDVAPDDLAQPAQLRSLLKDLREARQAKIRTALHDEGAWKYPYLRLQHMTSMELCEIKPFLVKTIDMLQGLRGDEGGDADE